MNKDLKNDPRYQNHASRPDLAGEHPLGDTYQGIAVLVFLAALAADYLWLKKAAPIDFSINFWLRAAMGSVFIGLGALLALSGIKIVFSDFTEKPRMITHRLFSIVRHPVYLGALLVYLGALIATLSPLGLAVFIAVVGLYDWLARDEEERMERLFGAAYLSYKSKVPRWLPRLRL